MPRVRYGEVECPDRGAHWASVPCLCDCHYRKGAPCGDIDRDAQPTRVRITRHKRPLTD